MENTYSRSEVAERLSNVCEKLKSEIRNDEDLGDSLKSLKHFESCFLNRIDILSKRNIFKLCRFLIKYKVDVKDIHFLLSIEQVLYFDGGFGGENRFNC